MPNAFAKPQRASLPEILWLAPAVEVERPFAPRLHLDCARFARVAFLRCLVDIWSFVGRRPTLASFECNPLRDGSAPFTGSIVSECRGFVLFDQESRFYLDGQP